MPGGGLVVGVEGVARGWGAGGGGGKGELVDVVGDGGWGCVVDDAGECDVVAMLAFFRRSWILAR